MPGLGLGLGVWLGRRAGGGPSTLLTGLAGHWAMTEAAGTRADSVGSNNLTQGGTVGSAAGIVGNAAVFDGNDANYLTTAAFTAGAAGTFAAWVRLDDASFYPMIVSGAGGGELRFEASSRRPEYVGGGGSATTAAALTLGTWHLIVGWWDGTNVYCEVDASTTIASAASTAPAFTGFDVGRRSGGPYALTGRVQYLSYWTRVLTAGERTELYNAGTPVPYPF